MPPALETPGDTPPPPVLAHFCPWGRSLTPLPNMQNGRYEVLETIGSGATSRVDKARDTVIGRTVALKTFLRSMNQGTAYEYFLREAQRSEEHTSELQSLRQLVCRLLL